MVQIVDYNFKIRNKIDARRILESIENAGRTCYKSENIAETDEQAFENTKRFVKGLIDRGHESVLEHEYISIEFTADVGFYKDLTRHRVGIGFSIESTRWCRYGKGKQGDELYFMNPVHIKDEALYQDWLDTVMYIEAQYKAMSSKGAAVDVLRMILPHSTKATIIATFNIRALRHVLKIRTEKCVHPTICGTLTCLLEWLQQNIPVLFDDIESEVTDEYYTKRIRKGITG